MTRLLFILLSCSLLGLPLLARSDEQTATIERLIRQLGDEDFEVRQEATAKLAQLGEPALATLKKAIQETKDVEVKRRAAVLIARIEKETLGELLTIQGPMPGYWINRVTFSRDGKQAIATGGGVIWYDLDSGREVRRILEKTFARPGLALSKDGRFFATGHQNDKYVHVGEAATGNITAGLSGHTAGVWDVAFSPDGKQVVSGSDDKTMRLWDLKTNEEVRKFDHEKWQVRALAFSPDGKQIASGGSGNVAGCPLFLWDAATGKQVRTFKGHRLDVTAVLFTPDGKRLLSAGRDGALILWEVETGKELKRMTHGDKAVIYHAALSPDGKRALTAGFSDHTVRLWDVEKGTELRKYEGHAAVLGVAFSPDGKRALSSDTQCTIKLWKLPE